MSEERDPLAGLRPAGTPKDLMGPVIAAAREALAAEASRTLLDRIWESRPLRLAWAGSALALVLAHLGVTALTDARRPVVAPGRLAATENVEELREILRLPSTDRFGVGPDGSNPARREADNETTEDATGKGARS